VASDNHQRIRRQRRIHGEERGHQQRGRGETSSPLETRPRGADRHRKEQQPRHECELPVQGPDMIRRAAEGEEGDHPARGSTEPEGRPRDPVQGAREEGEENGAEDRVRLPGVHPQDRRNEGVQERGAVHVMMEQALPDQVVQRLK